MEASLRGRSQQHVGFMIELTHYRVFRFLELGIFRILPLRIKLAKATFHFRFLQASVWPSLCPFFKTAPGRRRSKMLGKGWGLIGSFGNRAFAGSLCCLLRHLIFTEITATPKKSYLQPGGMYSKLSETGKLERKKNLENRSVTVTRH